MKTAIIDYGMGNLGSVSRAFEECGASVTVAVTPEELSGADRIVLPGVGAFSKGMENLSAGGWIPEIRRLALEEKTPILGICLGMQLMASVGKEGGETAGLNLLSGLVDRLKPTNRDRRIPHVGWNEVEFVSDHPLFAKIPSGTDFYYVHSYHFIPGETSFTARTPYCGGFVAAIAKENMMGVQFHPEKSSKAGFQLIRNFLEI